MVVYKWVDKYLSAKDVTDVAHAISECETKTNAEVVPVVVRRSSMYYQSYITLRILGAAIFAGLWYLMDWDFYWDHFEWSILQLAVSFVVFVIWMPQLYKFDWVKRVMTHRWVEQEQAMKRAELEFFENSIHETKYKEGVLIFVSLLEHQVIVLTDKKISEKLSNTAWEEVVNKVIDGIKRKQLGQGLVDGIALCSDLLSKHFPVTSGDKDELPNKLIIKE